MIPEEQVIDCKKYIECICPSNWPCWFLPWMEYNVWGCYRGILHCVHSPRHILILVFLRVRTRLCDRPLRLLKNFLEQLQWWGLQQLNDSSKGILCALFFAFALQFRKFLSLRKACVRIRLLEADVKQSTQFICWSICRWWMNEMLNRRLISQKSSHHLNHRNVHESFT